MVAGVDNVAGTNVIQVCKLRKAGAGPCGIGRAVDISGKNALKQLLYIINISSSDVKDYLDNTGGRFLGDAEKS